MDIEYESRARAVDRAGEPVFSLREVARVVYNSLGAFCFPDAMRVGSRRLREYRIVSYKRHDANMTFYPQSKVWECLQHMQTEGVIALDIHGISTLDDIVREQLHQKIVRLHPLPPHRHDGRTERISLPDFEYEQGEEYRKAIEEGIIDNAERLLETLPSPLRRDYGTEQE